MVRSPLLKLIFLGLLILIIAFLMHLLDTGNRLNRFLSKNNKIDANILLIEGWISQYGHKPIDYAYKEFHRSNYDHIITTGVQSPEYFRMAENGFLIFYTDWTQHNKKSYGRQKIEIDALGTLEGDNASHFNVFINDSLISDFFTKSTKKKYLVDWYGALTSIDSIMIQFTNDEINKYGDRNLLVKNININNTISIPYQFNTVYDKYESGGQDRRKNNYRTWAEKARNNLLYMGIDSNSVTSISRQGIRVNKTLETALAVRAWLETTNIDVNGINILTIGNHARRSYMTYHKILKEEYDIGINSLQQADDVTNNLSGLITETIKIIYYWLLLITY